MTTGVISGAGTTYPAGEPEFTLVFFKFGSCCSIFSFLCSILLTIVFFLLFCFALAIAMSVLQITVPDCPFGIFNFSLSMSYILKPA